MPVNLATAQESFDKVIGNAVNTVLLQLMAQDKLKGKRLAVYGFRDVSSGLGCSLYHQNLSVLFYRLGRHGVYLVAGR